MALARWQADLRDVTGDPSRRMIDRFKNEPPGFPARAAGVQVSAINHSPPIIGRRSPVRLDGMAAYLGEITGFAASDDILGQVFSRFCIGK